ncbi:hypothetical protein JCM11251_007895 [Rhodosporidiobolus azoricus]
MADSYEAIAQAANNLLQELRFAAPPRPTLLAFPTVPPLLRLEAPPEARGLFEAEGCSDAATCALEHLYNDACRRIADEAQKCYASTVVQLQSVSDLDAERGQAWETGMRRACQRSFEEKAKECLHRMADEVRLARSRHSTSSLPPTSSSLPPPPPSEPGSFSPSNLALLNAAFSVRDSVSRAERRELARATGLNERQVLTWVREDFFYGGEGGARSGDEKRDKKKREKRFEIDDIFVRDLQFANQRQRRGKKEKAASAVSARASPYSHARHPSSSQSHHLPPLRTVSGSSTASSASLLSYAGGTSDEDFDIEAGGDIAVDAPAYAPPQTATFATFASQFQVAPLPPPPTFFQPPDEVPMMEFTSPTPITASFSTLGVAPSPPQPHPAPTFDFSAPLFLPSGSNTSPSPPTLIEDSSSLVDHGEWDAESFFSTSSCGPVPVAPAPTPSLGLGPTVAGEGGLDGWMDATFYENLLSSLGLSSDSTVSSESSSALSLDGIDGAGLTLSMEAVRAEVGGFDGGMEGQAGFGF